MILMGWSALWFLVSCGVCVCVWPETPLGVPDEQGSGIRDQV